MMEQQTSTKALEDIILGALSDAGGRGYLARMAIEQPAPFMALLGRVLPTTLSGDFEWPPEPGDIPSAAKVG